MVSRERSWRGAQELTVDIGSGGTVLALAYPELIGAVDIGTDVLLNVSALDRGLGTGGYALVVGPAMQPARDDTLDEGALAEAGTAGGRDVAGPRDEPAADLPGHLVKARYTPMQAMVLGVDEQESAYHDLLRDADDLRGVPVVVADLHSSLPAIVAGARWQAMRAGLPAPVIAYVMTDGGALPSWFSRTVSGLRDAGWIAATITSGQAFGGDLEAVTVHTALLAATEVVAADLVVVTQGPGNLGTGTRWGFSGVSAGEAINAAGTLHGRPVGALRVSSVDSRLRHRGLSHHCLTAYGRVARLPADIVVPVLSHPWTAFGESVRRDAAPLALVPAGHRIVEVDVTDGLDRALRAAPVPMSTMGRGLDDDPVAFYAAAAAGSHAMGLSSHDYSRDGAA